MSRRDYQAIAAIVARHVYDLNDAGIALIAELTDWLEADNERFDRERFVSACVGLPDRHGKHHARPKTYAALALDRREAQ